MKVKVYKKEYREWTKHLSQLPFGYEPDYIVVEAEPIEDPIPTGERKCYLCNPSKYKRPFENGDVIELCEEHSSINPQEAKKIEKMPHNHYTAFDDIYGKLDEIIEAINKRI